MSEQSKLFEIIDGLKNLAMAKNNTLTMEDVDNALEEMGFSLEQKETVCAYLKAGNINIENFDKDSSYFEEETKEETSDEETFEGESGHLEFYLEELEELNTYENVDLNELVNRLKKGDKNAVNETVSIYLAAVVEWISDYTDLGILRDDLIQEGNMALIEAVAGVESEEKEIKSLTKYLHNKVEKHIIKLVDESVKDENSKSEILKSIKLIEDAKDTFSKEEGRVPSNEELALKTGLDVEFVTKITKLLE